MSENFRLYAMAIDGFDHVVRLVELDASARPSPWTVFGARVDVADSADERTRVLALTGRSA